MIKILDIGQNAIDLVERQSTTENYILIFNLVNNIRGVQEVLQSFYDQKKSNEMYEILDVIKVVYEHWGNVVFNLTSEAVNVPE